MRILRWLPLAIVLFVVPWATRAEAQVSIWLKRGVSGFGLSGGVFLHDSFNVFDLSAGYSYQGWLDFGLDGTVTTFDDDTVGGQLDATGYGLVPSVAYHPIKQSKDGAPISLALTVGVPLNVLSSDQFEDLGIDTVGSYGIGGGVSIYRFFKLSSNIGITPAAALNVTYTHSYATDTNGDEIDDFFDDPDSTSVSFTAGGYLAYLDSGGRIWGLVPQVSYNTEEEKVFFGISLGVVFASMPPEPPPPYQPPPPPNQPYPPPQPAPQ